MRVLAWPAYSNKEVQPYNWLLYTHIARHGVDAEEFSLKKFLSHRYALCHFHWPESLLNNPRSLEALAKVEALLSAIRWARSRGSKIVWTVHNLRAHEGFYPKLEKHFWRSFISQIDGYISPSETGKKSALERFPKLNAVPGFVVPLGHYRQVYPDTIGREEARSRLGISPLAKVLLFFGLIRPYKNVSQLIRVFRQLSDPTTILVIGGRFVSPLLAEEVRAEASLDSRVLLHPKFIPDEEVQVYLRAADLVVLPYREVLNSSSALLALSFDRPVLVPELGALGELRTQVGEQWVNMYSEDLTPHQLNTALSWAVSVVRSERAPLEALDWDSIAQQTIEAYRTILAIPR